MTRLLVVEARFYQDISEKLSEGARTTIQQHQLEADFIQVPGALEIPLAMRRLMSKKYDGYVALGCVIRGETTHYEIVSEMSAWGLMSLGVEQGLAIGSGILTVENKQQALERAEPSGDNKGGGAVEACLALIKLA